MPKQIDLGGRFGNAFGFVGSNIGPGIETGAFEESDGAAVYVVDGRSSYENFTLVRNDGLKLQFSYNGLISSDINVFAPPALVTFDHSKRIGQTIVSSNDDQGNEVEYGEVVELYGSEPVAVTIQGILVDMEKHEYPSGKVRQLIDLFHYKGPWDVEGQIWRDHRIQTVYFTKLTDGPVQGFMDTWQFTLQGNSMKPVEYFLKANQ
jgi:hypothetical protein